jgi:uncharacterized protein YbjQ (UPF0145 family)
MWQILTLLIVSYFSGSWIERRHFKSLLVRESATTKIPIISNNMKDLGPEVESLRLVSGCAVVGADFFKAKLAALISIFGGNIAALESVMDRARREALLRLRAEADGADFICGVQYETCCLNDSNARTVPVVEIIVWGSAVYLKKSN